MKVSQIRMHEEGLNRFFGPLEARIMHCIWERGESSIKDVQSILNQHTPITFNAVMTVMNRLVEKGHLTKQVRNRLSYYQAAQTREQFITEQTKVVTTSLLEEFGDLVVNHMIDILDQASPESIEKLQRKLDTMKKRGQP